MRGTPACRRVWSVAEHDTEFYANQQAEWWAGADGRTLTARGNDPGGSIMTPYFCSGAPFQERSAVQYACFKERDLQPPQECLDLYRVLECRGRR